MRSARPRFRSAIDAEEFVPDSLEGFQFQLRGVDEVVHVFAFCDGRGVASTEDLRADREVKFIHQSGAKERGVEFPTAFAEQSFDFPQMTTSSASLRSWSKVALPAR